MGEKQAGKQGQGDQRSITRGQLQVTLMDFADRFTSSVATYAFDFENGKTKATLWGRKYDISCLLKVFSI